MELPCRRKRGRLQSGFMGEVKENMQSVGVTETLSYPDSIPSILNRDRVR